MSAASHALMIDERADASLFAVACDGAERGPSMYFELTGVNAAEVRVDSDHEFDRHVLASIIAVAAMDEGDICQRVGLSPLDFAALLEQWFPRVQLFLAALIQPTGREDDELAMVRDLLLANRSTDGETSRWLAHMVARRAMEPSHLWEDIGLRSRDELSRMLMRHFAPLAERNTRGMRWKRFFYRMLCEDDGFVMCTTPVCTDCCDFDNCFGAEDGEGRLARRRLESSLVRQAETQQ